MTFLFQLALIGTVVFLVFTNIDFTGVLDPGPHWLFYFGGAGWLYHCYAEDSKQNKENI